MNEAAERTRPGWMPREKWIPGTLAALLLGLFLLLLWLTWLRWGDPVVDTGRELEIPWKIAEGKLLYRDMAYNYGPFSPYLNGILLRLFGVHLSTIAWSGALAALAGMILVFRTCRFFISPTASACVAGVFLFECAFQHYYFNGIFNFILPYSFPAVHGMLFALWALILLLRYLEGSGRLSLLLAGLLGGFCFLCKVEVAGALLAALALLPLFSGWKRKTGWKTMAADTAAWAAPLFLVVLVGFFPFVAGTSFKQVVWENVFKPQLVDFSANVFFLEHLGLSDAKENLTLLAKSLGIWGILCAAIVFGGTFLSGPARGGEEKPGILPMGLAAITVAGAVAGGWHLLSYDLEFRGMPAVSLLLIAVSLFRFFRCRGDPDPLDAKILALSLFAVLALLRIFLTAGTFHYGFYLGIPGLILFAVFLVRILPQWLSGLIQHPRFFVAGVLCLLLILSARNFYSTSYKLAYAKKDIELSGPGGRMLAYPLPLMVDLQAGLRHLIEKGTPDDTLLVLPEGAVLNFLSGQRNPTYYNLFIPPELNPPGVEEKVINQIEEQAVDRIMVVNRSVMEYGFAGLGKDYGLALMGYIKANYHREASFGPEPYGSDPAGGCVIYRRNAGE